MIGHLMEREMREQPGLLAQNAEAYARAAEPLRDRPIQMVLLAARGSSDNAATFARYLIEVFLGIPVSLAAPSVITKHKADLRFPPCLAIGISQSGAAPDVAEVLSYMRAQGHPTLAITNTEGSRLTQEAEFSLLLNAGAEQAVAATKTYTASLLALYQVVRALAPSLPAAMMPSDDWVEQSRESAEAALGPVLRSTTLFSLARGFGFCTAQETALKLMECALLSCKSYSTADFQHGPKALAGHGSCAITFGDVPEGLAEQGCLIAKAPVLADHPSAPISEVIFGQWLALLAARARGLNPDDPRFLSKVTLTL